MTKRDLIRFCLTFSDAYEDYPFDDENWAAIRHRSNKKTFAFVYIRQGNLCVNLKCDPMQGDFLRSVFNGVTEAYHMNKQHWITVLLHSDVPLEEVYAMVADSYAITRPKGKKTCAQR